MPLSPSDKVKLAALLLLLAFMPPTRAAMADGLGLLDLYHAARVQDAEFAAAQSARDAGLLYRDIGLSNLLPSISASVDASRNDYTLKTNSSPTQSFNYQSLSYAIRLSQPLFDLSRLAAWHEGQARAELAEMTFAEAQQDLILRTSEAYFNYLEAKDNLELAKLQKDAYRVQMQQTEELYKSGVGTVTDAKESSAKFQIAEAQELAAINTVQQRRREMEKLIGPVPDQLRNLPEIFPLALPEPNDLDTWIKAAEQQNLHIMTQQLTVKIAETQSNKARAENYPTVSLTASRQISDNPNYFSDKDDQSKIGVIVNIPLYEGGRISAFSKQSALNAQNARQLLDSSISEIRIKTTQAFYGVLNGVAQIKALESAVNAANITVEGMQIGHKVGLRTNTDLLNAKQQYYSARRDLLNVRYSYLLNRLQLKATSGALTEDELIELDKLLQPSPAH